MEPFATVAQFRELMSIKHNEDDALIKRLLAAASGWIRSYLNRDINAAAYTDTMDGTGTRKLTLKQYPITGVDSVTVNGLALASSAFVARGASLARTDGYRWPEGYGNVVVSYTAGFAAFPDEVTQACLQLAAWRYRERTRMGESQIATPQGQNISFQTSAVPNDVKELLDNMRRVIP